MAWALDWKYLPYHQGIHSVRHAAWRVSEQPLVSALSCLSWSLCVPTGKRAQTQYGVGLGLETPAVPSDGESRKSLWFLVSSAVRFE